MRDSAALLAAVLVHAAALFFVSRVARPLVSSAPAPVATNPDADAIEIELVPAERAEALAAPAEVSDGAAAGVALLEERAARGVSRAARSAPGVKPEAEPATPLAPSGDAPSSAAAPSETALAAPAGSSAEHPIDLGIGADGWKRWLGADRPSEAPRAERAPGAPVVHPAPASSTGGLVEGLAEADRERMVGPSGPVVNALENAAHGEGATAFGVARFAVTVLRTGGVEVTLESATTGEAEWKQVAERAAQSLRAHAPPIKPPSQGERFVVDMSAEMRMPDGRRVVDLYGPRVEPVLPRIHTWSAGEKDMLRDNPAAASGHFDTSHTRANVELPGVYLAQKGKVCSYKFGLSLLGPMLQGGCEPQNIGAKPQRVVHAHVSRSELF
jgi:hypothetical protein